MLTIVYTRVSTDDQTEHSPEAQRRHGADFARNKQLGPPTFLSDDGWSGKNLERPAMSELLELVRTDQVAHLIVWRVDRLSRESVDLGTLMRLFEEHCVSLHSLNEGDIQIATAAGRLNVGIHGVLAQFYREQTIENSKMGTEQAARSGYWTNRPPTGYDLIDRVLVPNDDAPIVKRVFKLRAQGKSYPAIEEATGIKYSTVRRICGNRVYLGLTRYGDEWFPGRHQALISEADFESIQRANPDGKRVGRDLLSGKVICGGCSRRVSIDTNGRDKPIYRCRHRGQGCTDIPGRLAAGLHRAARLGINELRNDDTLYDAISAELRGRVERAGDGAPPAARSGTITKLRRQRDKLLDLYLDEQISNEQFQAKEQELTAKINALEADHNDATEQVRRHSTLADAFEQAAALLRDPGFDFDMVWERANDRERRILIEELIETVTIHADRLEVTVTGAPPILVNLHEVGLRPSGTGPVASVDRREPPLHHLCDTPLR